MADESQYYEQAKQASLKTGIDADLIFAQWQIESAHFTSPNFRNNNNLAGQTWTPQYPEFMKGTPRPAKEGGYYVKYPNALDGYIDFLSKNHRYDNVKTGKTEEEQAHLIAFDGWAGTNQSDYQNYYQSLVAQMNYNHKKGYGSVVDAGNTGGFGYDSAPDSSNEGATPNQQFLDWQRSRTRNGSPVSDADLNSGAFALFKEVDSLMKFHSMDEYGLGIHVDWKWGFVPVPSGNLNPFPFLFDNAKAMSIRGLVVTIGVLLLIFGLYQVVATVKEPVDQVANDLKNHDPIGKTKEMEEGGE
jgi:hypothetical protein